MNRAARPALCVLSLLLLQVSFSVQRVWAAESRFCATDRPESVLRCIARAFAERDFDAYDRLLAPDFRVLPSELDSSLVPPDDVRRLISPREWELNGFRDRVLVKSSSRLSMSFPEGYTVSRGPGQGTWMVGGVTRIEQYTNFPHRDVATGVHEGEWFLVRELAAPEHHFEIVKWFLPEYNVSARFNQLARDTLPPPLPPFERVLRGPRYAFRLRPPYFRGVLKVRSDYGEASRSHGSSDWIFLTERRGLVALVGGVESYVHVCVDPLPSRGVPPTAAVRAALAEYEQFSPGIRVTDSDSLSTASGRRVQYVHLQDAEGEHAGAVAFIPEDSVLVRVGCIGHQDRCNGSLPDEVAEIRSVVEGYSSLTMNH